MDFKIDKIDEFFVVRDDLIEGGTKRRVLGSFIDNNSEFDEFIYASPRQGYGQLSLTICCMERGKKSTIFIPKGKHTWITEKTISLGGNIIEVPMGYLSVINKRARDYSEESERRYLMPFGFDHEEIVNEFGNVVSQINLDIEPTEIWSAISSGVLSRGLQIGFPNSKVIGVQIGHDTTEKERGRADLYRSKYKFSQPCKKSERPPFPSNEWYDSKVWSIMKEHGKPNSLFWNCGK
jgi:hypothetical protein